MDVELFREEMRETQEMGMCAICTSPTASVDALDIPWCEEHSYRGELVNIGMARQWCAVDAPGYSLAEGVSYWCITALQGDEECVGLLLAALSIDEQVA
jgi:hypothetical protein